MRLKENVSSDKLRGGYYTPDKLADFIIEWGLKERDGLRLLEPSCGDGVFLDSILRNYSNKEFYCTAVEIEEIEAEKARNVVSDCERFRINNEDFYSIYERELRHNRYDLIVGNPPYIRYQYLSQEQRDEQSRILTENGMRSNKLINSWVSFVVACTQMLNQDGKIGFVIPAELLQVAYAEDLRRYLMNHLQRITIITFKELVFPNVEQEVVVLLGEKDSAHMNTHQIRIIEYKDIDDLLENFYVQTNDYKDIEQDDSKWTRYFLSVEENALIRSIKQNELFTTFGDLVDVEVGITTGNNNYFCVNQSQVEEYNLEAVTRPLIARSVSIRGVKFTHDDWEYNINRGSKAYLIDFPDIPYGQYHELHKKYIELGESAKENEGYKCRIRERWYRVPSIWVPDAFFLRRNYLYPKLVLNTELNAVSTDTMHRIRINPVIVGNPERLLLSYYNSIALAFTEIEGRSYGGGVLEILPGEVEKVTIPNVIQFENISDEMVSEIVSSIDSYMRTNDDILGLLPWVDQKILVESFNIPEVDVQKFRNIWLKLRNRRLGRGKNNKVIVDI